RARQRTWLRVGWRFTVLGARGLGWWRTRGDAFGMRSFQQFGCGWLGSRQRVLLGLHGTPGTPRGNDFPAGGHGQFTRFIRIGTTEEEVRPQTEDQEHGSRGRQTQPGGETRRNRQDRAPNRLRWAARKRLQHLLGKLGAQRLR